MSGDNVSADQACLDAGLSSGSDPLTCPNGDDNYMCGSKVTGLDIVAGCDARARARAVPNHCPSRFTHRPDVVPLATIIEQGSCSTLSSRGSLCSTGHLPYAVVAVNASQNCPTRTTSDSSEDEPLHEWYKTILHKRLSNTVAGEAGGNTLEYSDLSCTLYSTRPPVDPTGFDLHSISQAQENSRRGELDPSKTLDVVREALHQMRTNSYDKDLSPSGTRTGNFQYQDHAVDVHGSDLTLVSNRQTTARPENIRCSTMTHVKTSFSKPVSMVRSTLQVEDHKAVASPSAESDSSQFSAPCLTEKSPLPGEASTAQICEPRLLPLKIVSRSRELLLPTRSVLPTPRDVEPTRVSAVADQQKGRGSTLHDLSDIPSSIQASCNTREPSRTTSFCSTSSSHYSSTILGVDTDLQHGGLDPRYRYHSPPSTTCQPMWFTMPQMAELERQASLSSDFQSLDAHAVESDGSRRSITSSALTALLPIAAASGIVKYAHDMPQISFQSPSGNLIQLEDYESPSMSRSHSSSRPFATICSTRGNDEALDLLKFSAVNFSAARPVVLPVAIPSLAPIAAVPRFERSLMHQRKEPVDIGSAETTLVTAPSALGCGGMVRNPNITPRSWRSGQHDSSNKRAKQGNYRPLRTLARDMVYETNFYKSQFIHRVTTSRLLPRKKKTVNRPKNRGAAMSSACQSTDNFEDLSTNKEIPDCAKDNQEAVRLGLLAGYALRICFCESYDDVDQYGCAVRLKSGFKCCDKKSRGGCTAGLPGKDDGVPLAKSNETTVSIAEPVLDERKFRTAMSRSVRGGGNDSRI